MSGKIIAFFRSGGCWRDMNMCSVCGVSPPQIGTMCNRCAGRTR